MNEKIELYPDPAKPSHSITVTFRAGGMHYSATRPIIRAKSPIVQKGKSKNNFHEGASQQNKSKQNKGTRTKRSKHENVKAQKRPSARWWRKIRQSQADKGVAAPPSQGSTLRVTQESMQSERLEREER